MDSGRRCPRRCGPSGRPHYDGPLRDRSPQSAPAPRLILRLAVALAALGALAGSAAAHTSLVATTPASGAALATAPTAVRVTYGAPLASVSRAVVRLGAENVAGAPRLDPRDASRVVIPLRSSAPGRYRASWVVVGQDGHALAGEMSFRVRALPLAVALRGMHASLTATARTLVRAARAASETAGP